MTKKKGISIFVFAAAAVLAASVIRFFLYVSAIDFTTGFYTAEGSAAAGFFSALLLIFVILLFALCLVGDRRRWTAFTVSSDGFGTQVTLVLGILYLAAAAVTVFGIVRAESVSPLSVIDLIGYAATGLLLVKNTAAPPITGGIHVALSLCLFFRALTLFNGDLVIRNHSDPMLRLLAYVFGALFFASSARCYARLEMKHSRFRELFLAGLTFLFSGAYTLGKLLAMLFGGNRVLGMEALEPAAAVLFLLSGGFLAALCFTSRHKEIEYLSSGEQKPKSDRPESGTLPQKEENEGPGTEEQEYHDAQTE